MIIHADALLFDMDGTLVDSTDSVHRIWAEFARRFDLDVEYILESSHGVRMIETIERHAPEGTDAEEVARQLSAIELRDVEGTREIAGARALLDAVPPDRLAVVTSAGRELAVVRLAAAGIVAPDTLVTADDVDRGKPDPSCYLLAAERLGIAPARAVVFEDAEAGILAGLAAGMTVVVVGDWTSPTTEGLPRLTDYSAVTVAAGPVGLTLTLG